MDKVCCKCQWLGNEARFSYLQWPFLCWYAFQRENKVSPQEECIPRYYETILVVTMSASINKFNDLIKTVIHWLLVRLKKNPLWKCGWCYWGPQGSWLLSTIFKYMIRKSCICLFNFLPSYSTLYFVFSPVKNKTTTCQSMMTTNGIKNRQQWTKWD